MKNISCNEFMYITLLGTSTSETMISLIAFLETLSEEESGLSDEITKL